MLPPPPIFGMIQILTRVINFGRDVIIQPWLVGTVSEKLSFNLDLKNYDSSIKFLGELQILLFSILNLFLFLN